MNNNKIILPLDNLTWKETIPILKKTTGSVWGYKVRRIIFEEGISVLKEIKQYGNIMVDFKFYDIPSAIEEAVDLFINNGVDIITTHMSADYEPKKHQFKYLAGVTILTSMKIDSFVKYYNLQNIVPNLYIPSMVKKMAENAELFNYKYIVCSGKELIDVYKFSVKKICPGIRPLWYQEKDDQIRTVTPEEAIGLGSDLLVIGRPLLNATDINKAIQKTNEEIENGHRYV